MASQTGMQITAINILPDISKSKGNWSIFEVIDIKRNKRRVNIDLWGITCSKLVLVVESVSIHCFVFDRASYPITVFYSYSI